MNRRIPLALGLLTSALCLLAPRVRADTGDPFEVITRQSKGRSLAAELADLDGDARSDLLQIVSTGVPPNENRLIRVYLQSARGELPQEPSFERALPSGSAAYDLADLTKGPGAELVLLDQQGVTIVSLSSPDAPSRHYDVGATTLGPGPDERGLERLRMVFEAASQAARIKAAPIEPARIEAAWIVVPTFNGPVVLDARGDVVGRLASPGRANYFIPQEHGLAFVESDLQLYYDAPHLSIGDVDGDGRVDLVSANRHALRIYLQSAEGRLPRTPSRTLQLELISERDHIRGSGGVVGETGDINGDGKLDLLLTRVGGTFGDSTVETRVYLNRDEIWDLDQPDRSYHSESAVGSDALMDLDGDGRLELLRATIKMSVLELIEVLVTRSLDVEVAIFRGSPGDPAEIFGQEASSEFKIEIPLNFETLRPAGFLANLKTDQNGDGYRDLLRSGRGDEISLHPGGPQNSFKRRAARQKTDTRGELSIGDWNADGLPDLLLFAPKMAEVPLRLLINRATLAAEKRTPER